jgi:CO/xanthine dehydrogenase FAD-binding subunit
VRSDLSQFELVPARSVAEACARVASGYRPLAGGTDVMVLLSSGKLQTRRFVDLGRLTELRGIEVRPDALVLGALTTYTDVRRHPVASVELAMLAQAARETGGIAIQNRGTLGGNLANASPAADSPPALLAYGADVELVSTRGARWVAYSTFHTGYKQTVAASDELIARILVPRAPRLSFYRKVGPRRAQAISKVCFAGCVERRGEGPQATIDAVRIALGGVAPVPLRVFDVERAVLASEPRARVLDALDAAIAPIDDVRSSARYRRRVAANLLVEFLDTVGLSPEGHRFSGPHAL